MARRCSCHEKPPCFAYDRAGSAVASGMEYPRRGYLHRLGRIIMTVGFLDRLNVPMRLLHSTVLLPGSVLHNSTSYRELLSMSTSQDHRIRAPTPDQLDFFLRGEGPAIRP